MPRKKIQPIYPRPYMAQARKLKGRNGWSQTKLGQAVGKSKQAISDYERGTRDPDYQTATAIHEVLELNKLHITIDDFYPKRDKNEKDRAARELVSRINANFEDDDPVVKINYVGENR